MSKTLLRVCTISKDTVIVKNLMIHYKINLFNKQVEQEQSLT